MARSESAARVSRLSGTPQPRTHVRRDESRRAQGSFPNTGAGEGPVDSAVWPCDFGLSVGLAEGKLRQLAWSFAAACMVVMLSACASSAGSLGHKLPPNRLIVLGRSIAGIQIGQSRASVEKAFGRGRSMRPGFVWYFGGRLLVDYWVHDGLQTWVGDLETTWPGFHTRSGLHVGSGRRALPPRAICRRGGECGLPDRQEPPPDAPGSSFTMRHGKVVKIDVFSG